MQSCPRCQQSNRPEARFCRECGQFLGATCPDCGKTLPAGSRFCDMCGLQLANLDSLTGRVSHGAKPDAEPWATSRAATTLPDGMAAAGPDLVNPAPAAGRADRAFSHEQLARPIAPEPAEELEPPRGDRADSSARAAEVEGGRRVVTMLFCDVHDSTSTAEKLDPEEWTEIINGAFEYMIRPIHRYEGTVARLMGDAILAFFGAPLSHEDDPQRAVLAGLDIVNGIAAYRKEVQRRWNIDFNVRVGINTGLVVVGNVGSGLSTEYTAMGDAINVAARMEQTAHPGTVQIAEGTYRAVAPSFEIEKIGAIDVKGKAEPVNAYRVLRFRGTVSRVRGQAGDTLPLIGRLEARHRLSAAIERVLQGNGQIVTIIGEVGMGKSRMIADMRDEWDQQARSHGTPGSDLGLARWYETFSLSYETSKPYSLFQNLLRQVLGISSGESPATLQDTLANFLAEMLPADRVEPAQHALAALFGLSQADGASLDGEAFKKQFYGIIASLLEVWTRNNPGVIVCDDLHWSDQASIDLLIHLFQLTDRLPILFVCAFRPDRDTPGWQVKVKADADFPHHYSEIQLTPLTNEESIALVNQHLPGVELPEALWHTILVQAAGNPFFLEEVVQALVDDGVIVPNRQRTGWTVAQNVTTNAIVVPDSLQSLLMARIDRLDESQRHTLQLAALIGRSFHYRVLSAIAEEVGNGHQNGEELDRQLNDLLRMNLITLAARMPEVEYIFRQALVQELAYSSILHKHRRRYHWQVGTAIEALFADHLEEHVLVLAHHFTAAGDHERAVRYHTMAGDAAFRLYANREAAQHYAAALEAAQRVSLTPEQLVHLYTRRGRALELSAGLEDAVTVYETMREKAVALGDVRMELAALIPLATLYCTPTSLFDPARGEALSDQAIELARQLNDRAAEARILWNVLNLNRFAGRTDQALEAGERSLAIARQLDLREQAAFTANDLCHLYNRTGRYDKAIAILEETRSQWRDLGNKAMLADNLATSAYVRIYTGDFDAAIELANEALRVSESTQNAWGCSYSQAMIGMVHWERGNPDLAMETMRSSLRYAEQAGFVYPLVYTRAALGMVLAELGALDEGAAAIREAIRIAEDGRPQLLRHPQALLAEVSLLAGDIDAAGDAIAAVNAHSGPMHMVQPNVLCAAECRLSLSRGDAVGAVQLAQQRLADLRRFGMRAYIPDTLLVLALAQQEAGQPGDALASLNEARDVATGLGSRWMEWRILAAMAGLASPTEAALLRAAARTIIDDIEGHISDPVLRRSFHSRPDVHILEHMAH